MFEAIRKSEFEARLFVSLLIVLASCIFAYGVFPGASVAVLAGNHADLASSASAAIGFLISAVVVAIASVLRMWAGTILSSKRVMAFSVQNDVLRMEGPYQLVRNPIYLADLLALIGFTLCMPPAALLMPLFIFLHYLQLVRYEEDSFSTRFGRRYSRYTHQVPRLIPTPHSVSMFVSQIRQLRITYDGFRNNALYVLFIPGFVFAAVLGHFFYAVLVGLPGVLDWAFVHTRKGLENNSGRSAPNRRRKKVYEDILYAQCWEDPHLDRTAFRIQPHDVVFTITSGGCNALTFLLDNPRKVIALDINQFQNFLLELKIRAFEVLSYEALLQFLGVRDSRCRRELYQRVRSGLTRPAREYWDYQGTKIDRGIIHCGRYEGYMKFLRTWLRGLIGRGVIEALYRARTVDERIQIYRSEWENIWWRVFTGILLSRALMTLFFDRAFFAYLDRDFSFGDHFAGRIEYALTRLPMRENYFLSYILLGRYYDEDHLPTYLARENYEIIRRRLDRIEIVTESCERYFKSRADSSISKFNFTNILEWMSPEETEQLLRETIRVAKNDAVLTYRNLLVPRQRPESLAAWIHQDSASAEMLFCQDRSFIYSKYVIEHIKKENIQWSVSSNVCERKGQ